MIEVLKCGGEIVIVDMGRYGLRKYGVPISGAMDIISATRVQTILLNDLSLPVLEIYLPGHSFKFHGDAKICLTGADAFCDINGDPAKMNQVLDLQSGDILEIGKMSLGNRIYLGAQGGFEINPVLGSYSPLPGIFQRRLTKGSTISINNVSTTTSGMAIAGALEIDLSRQIECFRGPEWQLLGDTDKIRILQTTWNISSKSNRMGYRLEGDSLTRNRISEIYSSSVMPGTVQLLPNGLPIILMRDCQTTGGYPRVLQIAERDINQMAQRGPGDQIEFHLKH